MARRRQITVSVIGTACTLALSACGGSGGSGTSGVNPGPVPTCDSTIEFCGQIPASANACTETQYWPFEMDSGQRPFTDHYPKLAFEETANALVNHLEASWTRQVDDLQQNDIDVEWRLTTVNGVDVVNNITVATMSDEVIVATVIPAVATSATDLTFDMRDAMLTFDEM